ncbi:glycine/betaine/sarcosine/D-proline family reductase selenoprotein B [Saccharopolyspora sp. K220]|uniref:glycine/sarcosine/betaine reductase selenoprotein B family protein n=1 Tax=Saccharopolyspora soli TaxID=2926618 RepID=UPI001F5A45F3|nr:glycine/sarcosine/betaine reductase selenoprotein B family protein [Saccharopolyspora soli]MCI2419265.1 glycine/betaine/sarcosine/D-proline family reductase selenoprotein B [Saccharopolyspora soli]
MSSPADLDLTGPAFDFDQSVAIPVLGISSLSVPTFDPPELTALTKPLAQATVGLLVTCGAYYPDQPRLGQRGDLSYRLLPRERDLSEVLIAHMTPIRAFALADPNVAYPRDTLLDLESDGVIGRYADNAISMVGSISQYEALATETAPRIVEEFHAMNVDLVLVVPFCPQCHVSAGVLARAIERRGLPTTSLTTLRHQARSVKPPRATFLDFPLGCPGGKPREHGLQRQVVRAALETGAAVEPGDEWTLHRLPFQWDADGKRDWESLVVDLYRIDNEIRGTVKANAAAHEESIEGREREFTNRCAC